MTVHARDLSRHTVPKTIPKIMRAVALDRFGGPEVLTLHELPTPAPDAGKPGYSISPTRTPDETSAGVARYTTISDPPWFT